MNPARRGLLLGGLAAMACPGPLAARVLPRLLAFGDSLTSGYGLGRREGLVPQLARWLAASGQPAEVLNGGLAGDTTTTARVRLPLSLRRHRPDAVMVALGGNDLLLRRPAAEAEANLDRILARAGAGGRPLLLVGIHAPAGDADWRRSWAEIWPQLAARHGAQLVQDMYAPLAAVPGPQRAPLLLTDGLHPSAEGIGRIVAHLGPEAARLIARL